jgi:hypothetical protein
MTSFFWAIATVAALMTIRDIVVLKTGKTGAVLTGAAVFLAMVTG